MYRGSYMSIWLAIVATLVCSLCLSCRTPLPDTENEQLGTSAHAIGVFNGIRVNGIPGNGVLYNTIRYNTIRYNTIRYNSVAIDELDLADITIDGAAMDAQQEAEFLDVLAYTVECALEPTQSIEVYDSGDNTHTFSGALALAPEWMTGALSADGEKLVSACLAARANALGQPVLISLRGPGLVASAQEADLFSTHEGVFWGNVFDTADEVKACVAQGGGLSGRVCAQSNDCGLTFVGDCNNHCVFDAALGRFTSCEGDTNVINTFLNLGERIALGQGFNCFRRDDASLWCFGVNHKGQLGTGASENFVPSPVQVSALGNDVAEVGGGRLHSCARTQSGTLHCWGHGKDGQLGDGSVGSGSDENNQYTPVAVSALGVDVASVGIFEGHTCGLKTDATMWCWGRNDHGQIGTGTVGSAPVATPTQIESNILRASFGTSAQTTCAVKADGTLRCWGNNSKGQVGNGSTADIGTPAEVVHKVGREFVPLADTTDVCSGITHTCARTADGKVRCWGANDRDQLGAGYASGTVSKRKNPVEVLFPGQAAPNGLSCGQHHTCAIRDDGALFCWGDNSQGALGDGGYAATTEPVEVTVLGNKVMNVSSVEEHTCATLVDGTFWCWGEDANDVLFPETTRADPIEVVFSCNGNGVCDAQDGESCDNCAADCGQCPAPFVSLTPTDDAFASQKKPDKTNGSGVALKFATSATQELRPFLQFDLSTAGLTNAASATLYLQANDAPASCMLVAIPNDAFDEASLTWNNMPASGSDIALLDIQQSGEIAIDVTAYVNGELIRDQVASFACEAQSGTARFGSKENGDPAQWPRLEVVAGP